MKLNNIRLLVNNFEQSFQFYNDILGLDCTWGDKNSNFASFDIGLSSGLAIFKAALMAEAIGTERDETRPIDKFAIVIEVDNVDETYTKLKNKINFSTEPTNMEAWGIRVAHFRDTENNLIEIFSKLAT
jgi:catechol 2,3-dioxygenase-like lactoylglutathione lyase family enzyme